VAGLVFAGGIGLTAIAAGCPTLTSTTVGEIQGWQKASNPSWTSGGAPVLLFYGSTGCPYCSATSWALLAALMAIGSVSTASLQFGISQEDNIPEVLVDSISVSSKYVSLDAREAPDFSNALAIPALGCTEQAYVSAYNPDQSRPFVVIDGQYFHVGTLVDPTTLSGGNPQTVYGQVTSQSGGDWQLIAPSAYALEAFLVKANGGQPSSLASNPNVHPLFDQIT
jgi:glutaredoxin